MSQAGISSLFLGGLKLEVALAAWKVPSRSLRLARKWRNVHAVLHWQKEIQERRVVDRIELSNGSGGRERERGKEPVSERGRRRKRGVRTVTCAVRARATCNTSILYVQAVVWKRRAGMHVYLN